MWLNLVLLFLLSFDSQVISDTVDTVDEQNAGIYLRLNQRAVDYISGLASEALPQLLNKLSPPDVEMGPARIYETLVHEVTKPDINARFVHGKGVRANISFPFTRVSSHATVSVFLFEYEGGFLVDLHNLTIGLEVHYGHNDTTNRNIIEASYCEVTHSDVQFIFDKDSSLNALRDELKDGILDSIRTAVCETSIQALQYLDEQDVQRAVAPAPTAQTSEHDFSAAELGSSLCEVETMVDDTTPLPLMTSLPDTSPAADWSADLSLVYPPKFTDDDVVFGVDGGITLNGEAARLVEKPKTLNTSVLNEKMVGILLSEYIPNTLLAHVYDNGIGSIHERFSPDHLPKSLRKIGRMMCASCYLDVTAHLTDKPFVQIKKELGARVQVSANVTIKFQGRHEMHDLIHATSTLHITLKPTIRHSRVYGDVSLTSVDVNIFELGIGGAMAGPLSKVVSMAVPRVLWPQVKKRLRFALNRRGIQLPVLCGVELEHLSLSYIDHAVVLNTDFQFDLPLFVTKFKRYLRAKATKNPSLPKYLD